MRGLGRQTLVGRWDIMGDGGRGPVLVGDDLESILAIAGDDEGDDGGQALVDPRARRAAASRILAANAKLLKETQPDRARRFPLGFASAGTIAPGIQATITSQPQVLFRGERLIVPSDVAGDFTIDDCKVGKDSQFVAAGPIPARTLQENAWGVDFQLDTAQVSQFIQLIVTNISGAARQFRATLIGSAVE